MKLSVGVHFLVIVLIFAGYDGLPPAFVVKIPFDGLLDTVRKLGLGQPSEFIMNLGRVDGITHIVTLSVGYVCDEALGFTQFFANKFYDVDISHFVMTADIVYFSDSALVDYEVDCLAVILYIKPVSDVKSFAVYGKGLVMKRIDNHKRYELLGKMIRSVVVRTAADTYGKSVCSVVCEYQKIRTGLG